MRCEFIVKSSALYYTSALDDDLARSLFHSDLASCRTSYALVARVEDSSKFLVSSQFIKSLYYSGQDLISRRCYLLTLNDYATKCSNFPRC